MKEIKPKQIRFYQTESGKIPYKEWFDGLKDCKVRHRIRARLDRVELGNFGDYKVLSNSVSELRFTFGSGYRIYFAEQNDYFIILLCGGDKKVRKKTLIPPNNTGMIYRSAVMNKDKILHNTVEYHSDLLMSLRDTKEAFGYLQVALEEYQEDDNLEAFLCALKNVAAAQGGITRLAKTTKLNRQNLYKILSEKGNPRLDNFGAILKGLGFKLAIEPYNQTRG